MPYHFSIEVITYDLSSWMDVHQRNIHRLYALITSLMLAPLANNDEVKDCLLDLVAFGYEREHQGRDQGAYAMNAMLMNFHPRLVYMLPGELCIIWNAKSYLINMRLPHIKHAMPCQDLRNTHVLLFAYLHDHKPNLVSEIVGLVRP